MENLASILPIIRINIHYEVSAPIFHEYNYIYTICITHYVRTAGMDSGLSLQESKVFIIRALQLPGWGPLNEDLQLGISKVTQVPHMLHNYVSVGICLCA